MNYAIKIVLHWAKKKCTRTFVGVCMWHHMVFSTCVHTEGSGNTQLQQNTCTAYVPLIVLYRQKSLLFVQTPADSVIIVGSAWPGLAWPGLNTITWENAWTHIW